MLEMPQEMGCVVYGPKEFITIYAPCNPNDNPEIGDKLYLNIIGNERYYGVMPDDNVFGGWNFCGICYKEKNEIGYIRMVYLEKGFIT
jgi:hypothetical protein